MTRDLLIRGSEEYIKQLLNRYLPPGTAVYVFGSRARNSAAWNADYDLWIDGELDKAKLDQILDDLDESFVPFKVDIVLSSQIKGAFGDNVKREAKRWM